MALDWNLVRNVLASTNPYGTARKQGDVFFDKEDNEFSIYGTPLSVLASSNVSSRVVPLASQRDVTVKVTSSQAGTLSFYRYEDVTGTTLIESALTAPLVANVETTLVVDSERLFKSFKVTISNSSSTATAYLTNLAIAVLPPWANLSTSKVTGTGGTVQYTNSGGNVFAEVDPVSGVIKNLNPDGSLYNTLKQSDSGIDYIAYGLTLPTSGTIGVASIAPGVAYVSGFRIPHAGSVLALEPTKDSYVDIDYDGNIVVSAVAVAAAAPAKAANSLRLGYCTTNATAVTGATKGVKDSNGNWMGNMSSMPFAASIGGAVFIASGPDTALQYAAGTTNFDNARMHSETDNPSRFTAQQSGLYRVEGWALIPAGTQAWTLRIYKNGANAGLGTMTNVSDKVLAQKAGGTLALAQGDYVELFITFPTTGVTISASRLEIAKVA